MTDDAAEKTVDLPPAAPEVTEQNRIIPSISAAIPEDEVARITADLIGVLKTVYDPEIPVDIYELGLIYKVDLDDDRHMTIDMTLTAPGCPVAGEMPRHVEHSVRGMVPELESVTVELVWDPPWDKDMMSEAARLELGFF